MRSVPDRRLWSIVQLVVVLVPMEGALWSQGTAQARWYIAAVLVLIASVLLSHPRASALGIGLDGLRGAAWAVPVAVIVCMAAIGTSIWLGTFTLLYGPKPIYWHSMFYAIWALEQQFILNSFFYNRFEHLLGDSNLALVVSATLFAFVHIPNPVLVPATFLGGLFFVEVFRRWRNIYPLAIAHAMFGLTLAVTVPDNWIRHMRVGLGFLRFHARG